MDFGRLSGPEAGVGWWGGSGSPVLGLWVTHFSVLCNSYKVATIQNTVPRPFLVHHGSLIWYESFVLLGLLLQINHNKGGNRVCVNGNIQLQL